MAADWCLAGFKPAHCLTMRPARLKKRQLWNACLLFLFFPGLPQRTTQHQMSRVWRALWDYTAALPPAEPLIKPFDAATFPPRFLSFLPFSPLSHSSICPPPRRLLDFYNLLNASYAKSHHTLTDICLKGTSASINHYRDHMQMSVRWAGTARHWGDLL